MKVINFQNFVLLAITFICIHSCKRDDAPQNPCGNSHTTSAAFKVEEDFAFIPDYDLPYWQYYATDTIATDVARFSILDPSVDSCIWRIGAGIYKTKVTKIEFTNQLQITPSFNVPVTCIAYRKPDKRCFPNDDGIDTSSRMIYVTKLCNALINGSYQGYLTNNPTDTFTVHINTCYPYAHIQLPPDTLLYISNLYRDSALVFSTGNPLWGNRQVFFNDPKESYSDAQGIARLSDKDHIDIIYTLSVGKNPSYNDKHFIGTRIK